jgi:protein-disulfide isomerase
VIARLSVPVWFVVLGTLSGCVTAPAETAETVSSTGRVHSAPPSAPRELPPDPMALGDSRAPVALVVFSDYQCSYCYRLHREVLGALRKDYIDTGKVRLIHKDLPLPMHKEALPAAIAARCAAAQGRFWQMDDLLFANQGRLSAAVYFELAEKAGLDAASFRSCQANPATRQAVMRDRREAGGLGINATPTLVLGRYDGERMRTQGVAKGFVTYDTLKGELDKQLAMR